MFATIKFVILGRESPEIVTKIVGLKQWAAVLISGIHTIVISQTGNKGRHAKTAVSS